MNDLSDLVKDWGGFERLVAELHNTGDVSVDRDIVLEGRSGAARQIDVLVRHKQGLYEHKVIVECKYWNRRVERMHVDALATTIREVGADQGVIFSTEGFQSGAITEAEHQGIRLFKVREPTVEEWGLPGRHVDLWLHFISISLNNIRLPAAFTLGEFAPSNFELALGFGDENVTTKTPIRVDGKPDGTLEALVERMARDAAAKAYQPRRVIFKGNTFEGELRFVVNVNVESKALIQTSINGGLIFIPKMTFDLGVRVDQKRMNIDRGADFLFVLAVEDCVRKVVTAASRRVDEDRTSLTPLSHETHRDRDEVLQNGSILSIWLKGIQPFEGFEGLEPGKGKVTATPPPEN